MPRIDYFYSAHSAYAYLGANLLYQICRNHAVELVHRPIDLGPVIEAAGGMPFSGRSQGHVDYFFGREIERWAEWRDVPIIAHRPSFHDNSLALANGLIIAAQEAKQDVDALSFAILEAHWRYDEDHANPTTLSRLVTQIGLDASRLLDAAKSDPIQALHAENTQQAISLGLFGSPTYVVDGDPFYGQDRLEFVERALTRPFEPNSWTNPLVSSPRGN